HFARILRDITSIRPFVQTGPIIGSTLVRLDEPSMFKYPVAYLSEPGGWLLSDAELTGLQKYIKRGGFIIFDDIEGEPNPDYRNLLAQWTRAFPGSRPIRLANDPRKRMVAIIDNYADIGEFIEWSDEGFDVVPANESYKLWVNYFVYALTH